MQVVAFFLSCLIFTALCNNFPICFVCRFCSFTEDQRFLLFASFYNPLHTSFANSRFSATAYAEHLRGIPLHLSKDMKCKKFGGLKIFSRNLYIYMTSSLYNRRYIFRACLFLKKALSLIQGHEIKKYRHSDTFFKKFLLFFLKLPIARVTVGSTRDWT